MPGLGFFKHASQNDKGVLTISLEEQTINSTFPQDILQSIIDIAKTQGTKAVNDGKKVFILSDLIPNANDIDNIIRKHTEVNGEVDWAAYKQAIKNRQFFAPQYAMIESPFDKTTVEKISLVTHTTMRQFYTARPNHAEEIREATQQATTAVAELDGYLAQPTSP